MIPITIGQNYKFVFLGNEYRNAETVLGKAIEIHQDPETKEDQYTFLKKNGETITASRKHIEVLKLKGH